MFDRTPPTPSAGASASPPPLVVAASLVAIQGLVLVCLAVAESFNIVADRVELALATAVFFFAYGGVLLTAAFALTRCQGWARGPVLLTQLIQLGIAWNVRDSPVLAIVLAVVAVITLAGMLHPASLAALLAAEDPESPKD